MTKRTLGIIIAVTSLGLLVGIVQTTKPKPVDKDTSNKASTSQKQISAETVAAHATRDDCWTIINDKVYNLTEYVQNHPGGNEILRACGKDATQIFNTRRDSGERVGSGTPHSSSAKNTLESFQIGELSN